MAETKEKELKFEDALKGLEKIVEELEKGNLALDVSLKKYEEGVKLAQQLAKRLEQAQKRVEVLMRGADGTLDARPFDTEDAGEPAR